ncbi:hypothetical protein INP81_07400 [Comamonas thiooxydans]|uniref:hypothetical protein n=1 Tax=Comamonas thiooxydans TaxID=363952 RepID=UPI0018A3D964|nr:hypothetical protein [Comamonas thiooxydans]QOQ83692.1 hypothetical protein INP81_07400 [Comamonas thiooxydans]
MTEQTTPEVMTLSQFNKHMGFKGRYVYQLRDEGRLVLAADGKSVLVAQSIARIHETKDPSRAAVADRHAQVRGYEIGSAENTAKSDANADEESTGSYDFQGGKAKKEHFAALREEAAYYKEIGNLMDADEAIGAFADAGAKVAAVLDAVPATVGPMLAGLEQAEVIRVLTEQMDIARSELSAAMSKLAAEIAQRRGGGEQ